MGVGAVERRQPALPLVAIEARIRLDRPALSRRGALDGGSILAPEVVVGEGEERRAFEPGLDLGEQGRFALGPLDQLPVLGGEAGRVHRSGDPRPTTGLHSKAVLDQAELDALESRCGHEQTAKVEEVERRHRLQHVDLVEQQPLDLRDAVEVADCPQHVAIGDYPSEDAEDGIEFVEDLLEPQLVCLMDDDEQQLVVSRLAEPIALGLLTRQEPVEVQVVVVVQRLPGGGVAHRQRRYRLGEVPGTTGSAGSEFEANPAVALALVLDLGDAERC